MDLVIFSAKRSSSMARVLLQRQGLDRGGDLRSLSQAGEAVGLAGDAGLKATEQAVKSFRSLGWRLFDQVKNSEVGFLAVAKLGDWLEICWEQSQIYLDGCWLVNVTRIGVLRDQHIITCGGVVKLRFRHMLLEAWSHRRMGFLDWKEIQGSILVLLLGFLIEVSRDCSAEGDLVCSMDLAGNSVGVERSGIGKASVRFIKVEVRIARGTTVAANRSRCPRCILG
ncbi:hypothetical protein NE237_014620 [Protea cynaroides]|uniref:Uncharacterized protein n=1 Tax=Protea cynaroides TaxID=273540 RepID=A0A9Q0QQG0_9MAGN|nr:hypothetical protein NE237_014620 [Protea cynaroides]